MATLVFSQAGTNSLGNSDPSNLVVMTNGADTLNYDSGGALDIIDVTTGDLINFEQRNGDNVTYERSGNTVTIRDASTNDVVAQLSGLQDGESFTVQYGLGQLTIARSGETITVGGTTLPTDGTPQDINAGPSDTTPPSVNSATFNIDENSADASAVGQVQATDNVGVTDFSIIGGNTDPSGGNGPAFGIDSNGNITVNDTNDLDFETTPTFNLTVQAEDAAGNTDTATVTVNLNDLVEGPNIINLSTDPTENITVGAGQVVKGDETTFNNGDTIQGLSGTLDLNLTGTAAPPPLVRSGTVDNLDLVIIDPNGFVKVDAASWTNIDEIEIEKVDNNTDFEMVEIQGSIPVIFHNDVDNASKITTHYDAQDLNANANVVNHAVKQVEGGEIVIRSDDNSTVREINLDVRDDAATPSRLADLTGEKELLAGGYTPTTEVLNISGGQSGIPFEITGALDPTLLTLNAASLESDADFNVSESTETMDIDLGDGDDIIRTGDTLIDDAVDGGGGDNRLIAEFDATVTRTPTLRNIQLVEAEFKSSVTLNGSDFDGQMTTVDLVGTEELRNLDAFEDEFLSSDETGDGRIGAAGRADLNDMKSSFATVNVKDSYLEGFEVDYAAGAGASSLDINLVGPFDNGDQNFAIIGNNQNTDAGIALIDVNEATIRHNADTDVHILNGVQVDEDFGPSTQATEKVSIFNDSIHDLVIGERDPASFDPTVLEDARLVRDVHIESTESGNIFLPVDDTFGPSTPLTNTDFMKEAEALQTVAIKAATDSNIHVGQIGKSRAATDLEQVTIMAGISSDVRMAQIEGEDGTGDATVDLIDIHAMTSAFVDLRGGDVSDEWFEGASINEMNVHVDSGARVEGDDGSTSFGPILPGTEAGSDAIPSFSNLPTSDRTNLIELEMDKTAPGSVLTVTGTGTGDVEGFVIEGGGGFETVDVTGLTGQGSGDIANGLIYDASDGNAFTFLGSERNDWVDASDEADILRGGGGDDYLESNGGEDTFVFEASADANGVDVLDPSIGGAGGQDFLDILDFTNFFGESAQGLVLDVNLVPPAPVGRETQIQDSFVYTLTVDPADDYGNDGTEDSGGTGAFTDIFGSVGANEPFLDTVAAGGVQAVFIVESDGTNGADVYYVDSTLSGSDSTISQDDVQLVAIMDNNVGTSTDWVISDFA